jgi:hypothetical protein
MDKRDTKKSEEEYEKEYATKIGVLSKALESDKADKVLLDLIEVIPRETKSEQLKVSFYDF